MIDPLLSNIRVVLGREFFPKELTEKYDMYLYNKNYPLKNIYSYIHESIQVVSIPGHQLQTMTIAGMNNMKDFTKDFNSTTTNRTFPGNAPWNEVIDGININITFRNTILNWIYFFEWFYNYYKITRNSKTGEFGLNIIMKDSAEIPMIDFGIKDCFISGFPGLEFAFNANYDESKTFDITMVFNKFNIKMLLPEFKNTKITI